MGESYRFDGMIGPSCEGFLENTPPGGTASPHRSAPLVVPGPSGGPSGGGEAASGEASTDQFPLMKVDLIAIPNTILYIVFCLQGVVDQLKVDNTIYSFV